VEKSKELNMGQYITFIQGLVGLRALMQKKMYMGERRVFICLS